MTVRGVTERALERLTGMVLRQPDPQARTALLAELGHTIRIVTQLSNRKYP